MIGGATGCKSEVGVGSTFWVDLPLAGCLVGAAQEKNPVAAKKNMGGGLPAVCGTVLYIEDNPDNLGLMETVFSHVEGATLLSAHNAELGLSLAVDRKPDAIIMDINLPGINGFEAFEHLMSNNATRAIPVIALSANAHDIEKGEKAGFYRYLTKPVDLELLLQCLQEAMGKRP